MRNFAVCLNMNETRSFVETSDSHLMVVPPSLLVVMTVQTVAGGYFLYSGD